MKLILTAHNLTPTEAIENHIRNRIQKLEHLNQKAIETRVHIEHDQTQPPQKQFKCAIRLAVRGPDLYAEDHENNLYTAIDLVTKKIEQQIRKLHNKKLARRTTPPNKRDPQ